VFEHVLPVCLTQGQSRLMVPYLDMGSIMCKRDVILTGLKGLES
jgi:hypothetical protein